MKVYFCGAHSVGKSSLARHTSTRYNLPMISETARMILSEQELQINTLRCDLDSSDKYQKQVFERQIVEEKKYKSFVSDRSIIDILAYSAQHTRITADLLARPEMTSYLNGLRKSVIFFVRPSKATLKDDGVRESISWDGIISVDAMIKLFLQIWKLKYHIISTDNIQERIQIIDAILSD